MYEDYEDLVERLRECTAEQNGEKTLWCQAADAIDNLLYICKHQATEIEELRKAVLRLEDESGIYDELPMVYIYPTKWISVEERLPEEYKDVLCYYEYFRYGDFNRMFRTIDRGYYVNGRWGGEAGQGYKNKVLAWMPLPEAPKDGK